MENTPEIRIPVEEEKKFPLMARLVAKADFSPGKVTTLDGIRVDYNDCWGLVRASNTGPHLIARFEGRDADALGRIERQFREQINMLEPDLDLPF
jgi:phosphomannomutase/phosphoglucomutase